MVSHEFGSGDLPKEPLVTIAAVKKPDEQDETTKDWWLITFAEPWAKPLKVNRTHQSALILMFGAETEGWKGKRIGLRAMAGTFFGRRQTAVRIKGSPDLSAPASFTVRKFGGGTDTYNLEVMPDGKKAADGREWLTFGVGSKKAVRIVDLSDSDLAASIALGDKNVSDVPAGANPPWLAKSKPQIDAMRAELAMREGATRTSPPPPEDPPF